MKRIGLRIKAKRESMGLQIKDLSGIIEVSSSLISQIEKAKAYPSIFTLKKIAEALNTTISELLGENENRAVKPVMRLNNRKFVRQNDNGTSLFLLSNHDPLKQMEPYLVHFEQGSDSSEIMTSNYPCQEFCYILKGNIEVKRDKKKILLHEGDSFYFNSHEKHIFKNIDKTETELIWVVKLN
ncbi:MAG: helix-turn-helix transcriptional regulator [Candidatus Delongbacteria bacterium]|nr:helix-turn-helix transcriptional regulator [Candidatus Delongbacteria bacterium]